MNKQFQAEQMKIYIKHLIKEYNLIQELKNNQDIVDRYKTGDLCSETDEKYANGLWDLSGDIATRGIPFDLPNGKPNYEWDEAFEKQDHIYYALHELMDKQL